MTYARPEPPHDPATLPPMPGWAVSRCPETPEDVAFLSGAALAHLHLVLSRDDVPQALLRERLALRAAEACAACSGRIERAPELRDAVQFLQPGDHPGPAGEIYLSWRRAVERPVSPGALHRALPELDPGQIAAWLDGSGPRRAGQGGPVSRAAAVLQTVLQAQPRADTAAMLLADAALAQSLGWPHAIPLLAVGLRHRDLRADADGLRLAAHRAVAAAAAEAALEAAALARRAARLRAVAPNLRARGAGEAVGLFLTRDAVAPPALTSLRSERAARRFCDRLVALGVVQELTGRDTFRLYGI
ncbi:DUF1403 family protein (plasmid) [Leisingera aquaemixtae]|uniref:DUF1403 family protein n=1 Tax=Leisingera aquaemixtae TaxID=1396826 RepID=A0ABY5WQW9_9RHOB|nr:DUF1403 family protein [Leisingera aquaemixtae]UWQ43944.1 DUF1403 family protein [Leisingera aquaemixtae]